MAKAAETSATHESFRDRLDAANRRLMDALNDHARVVQSAREANDADALAALGPDEAARAIETLVATNTGPFSADTIRSLFAEVFRASQALAEGMPPTLRVARKEGKPDVVVRVRGRAIGLAPVLIAGPCAVEDEAQMEAVAASLGRLGIGFLRGGAYKPRTSPYAFQGLGEAGLELLEAVGRRHDLVTISEAVDPRTVELVARHADIVQVGSRNMASYELLKAVAATGKPVLLKRGFGATLDELLQAAEYFFAAGNENVVLCERGIRTFERETRFTLDISAVPLLRGMSRLPVIVDVSHAAGRRDIVPALARAALAAGAHGVMLEVHPHPDAALSDGPQQLDLRELEALLQSFPAGWNQSKA